MPITVLGTENKRDLTPAIMEPGALGEKRAEGKDEPQTAVGGIEYYRRLAKGPWCGPWRCLSRGGAGQLRSPGGGESEQKGRPGDFAFWSDVIPVVGSI